MDKLVNDFSIGLFAMQAVLLFIIILVMKKFAWKPILSGIEERENKIQDAISAAEKTQAEMKALQAQNESMMKEARAERDAVIREAKETANQMIEKAKAEAKTLSEKELENARTAINAEKAAAISELKTQVASVSLEIAEKIVRGELASDEKQKTLASKLAEDISLN